MFSFEALLVLGAVGFYLYDSSMLLCINEVLFVRERNCWKIYSPEDDWIFLRRRLYIPNPLKPHVAIFRVYWLESGARKQDNEESLEVFIAALVPFQYLIRALLILFFAGLPFVVLFYGSGTMLLWMFGAIYLNISAILVFVYQRKEVLGLSNKILFALVFESLACAPFALNIMRKITLHHSIKGDPIEFAKNTFDKDAFQYLIKIVCRRIDEQLELVDIDDLRYKSLQSYKDNIYGMK